MRLLWATSLTTSQFTSKGTLQMHEYVHTKDTFLTSGQAHSLIKLVLIVLLK